MAIVPFLLRELHTRHIWPPCLLLHGLHAQHVWVTVPSVFHGLHARRVSTAVPSVLRRLHARRAGSQYPLSAEDCLPCEAARARAFVIGGWCFYMAGMDKGAGMIY